MSWWWPFKSKKIEKTNAEMRADWEKHWHEISEKMIHQQRMDALLKAPVVSATMHMPNVETFDLRPGASNESKFRGKLVQHPTSPTDQIFKVDDEISAIEPMIEAAVEIVSSAIDSVDTGSGSDWSGGGGGFSGGGASGDF